MALTWRNLRLQYQNPWMGILWGVINPLLMTTLFYVILGKRIGSDFIHYFLYIYSGFILWSVFGVGLSRAYISFLQHYQMVKQIYFPRVLLPITSLAAKLIDFLVAYLILIVLLVFFGPALNPGEFIIYSFLGILSLCLVASGIFLAFSVLCVRYRGFQVVFPFISQGLFFTAPIIYDATNAIDQIWIQKLFQLNPLHGVLYIFRLGIFHKESDWIMIAMYLSYSMIIFVAGYLWFKLENHHLIDRL